MKHLAFALSVSAVVLTAGTTLGMSPGINGLPPAPLDHMVCYQMTDSLKSKSTASFLAQLQPEFTQDGCTLLKPIEFCVPATKLNVSPAPPNPNIGGLSLANDYICYKAKCPNPVPPPSKVVVDQFGSHLEQNYKLTKICVPARKRPLRCPVGPIVKGGPACGGACPSPTQICKTVGRQCTCIDEKTCGGKPDAAGQCGGPCPVGEVCKPGRISPNPTTAVLPLTCACQPPVSPVCGINELTGQCGGSCPNPSDQCVFNSAEQCTCEPANPPCEATNVAGTALACGGVCPLPGQTCGPDGTGACTCTPPAQCGQDPVTGTCGGKCTDPTQACTLDATGQCNCQGAVCGSQTTTNGTTAVTTCGGSCPPGQQCTVDATGACNCQNGTTTGCTTCNPVCDPPGVCVAIAGTTDCRCEVPGAGG